jgi:hypothetical protein
VSAENPEAQLRGAAERLDEISALLRSDQIEDGDAVKLAQEAAQIAADVGAIAADAARAASEGSDSI